MSRADIITTASSQNGIKEDPAGSNMQPYGAWYGMNGVKWCAIFVSWVYYKAGHPLGKMDTPKGYHYCQSGYAFFKNNNQLTANPQQGDIVFFDWSGDGHCDHTGIFDSWLDASKKQFYSWEGNTELGADSDGGKVMKRKRSVTAVKAFASPAVLGGTTALLSNIIQQGDTGAGVTQIQKLLWQLSYPIEVDGEFGPQTKNAVLAFQKDHFLEQTGIVSPELKAAMAEVLYYKNISNAKTSTASYLRQGNAGAAVLELQKILKQKLGLANLKTDGIFGSDTLNAVIKFQQQNHLDADGVVGPKTFAALGIQS